jgi:hypothetical protein
LFGRETGEWIRTAVAGPNILVLLFFIWHLVLLSIIVLILFPDGWLAETCP